ncbi:MAG: glycosyltransferase family 4 protein [Candidatus Zambryskibacteria bacterium]
MEKSRKILIFSTAYYPFVGGAEVAIKEITDRIPDIQFDLITAKLKRNLPKVEKVENVNVYRLGFGIPVLDKFLLPFWGAIKTIKLNNKNHYSAYWCMMVTFAGGAAYVANILSDKKIPVVLTLQEGDSEEYLKTKWFGLIDLSWRLALKRSSAVTVISNYLGRRAKELGFSEKSTLIPNGVDVSHYSEIFSLEELKELSDRLGRKEENTIILISTSRLVIKNGLDLVIRALPLLPENIHFFNFGFGKDKKYLIDLAGTLGVGSRVHLEDHPGHDVLPQYLKISDIFIRPSRSEGQGISFLEAMAAKIPVIATPVGGIVDFLRDGETGYFCQPKDPESIAETVKKVISDPNKNKIVENAYKMVKEKYDWDSIAGKMGNVLTDVSMRVIMKSK